MKTTQERRWALAHVDYVRGKRNFSNLPNNWDDYCYARREKGWKRTKKRRQWMKNGSKTTHKVIKHSQIGDRISLERLQEMASKNKTYRSLIGCGYYDTITPHVILRNVFENPGW